MNFTDARIVGVGVNPDKYMENGERCTLGHSVSSSSLKVFSLCPSKYKAGVEDDETASKDFGSLLDCVALTPNQVNLRFSLQPDTYTNDKGEEKPWANNANACKKWKAEQIGKRIVTREQMNEAGRAVVRLTEDKRIASFIEHSDTQVWVAGKYKDEETGLVIPVRCLIDLVPHPESEYGECIADLKTTRNAEQEAWRRDMFKFGYWIQAAFNLDLYNAATDEERTTFCHIIQENTPPYEPARRMVGEGFMEMGRLEYRAALSNYAKCLKSGIWPGYDDTDESSQGWTNVEPEPWMETKAQFDPKYIFDQLLRP